MILADIYAARETDTLGMSSEMIAEELKKKGCDAYYFPSFEEIENFCLDKCQKGDVLITMGAGNVVNIGENPSSRCYNVSTMKRKIQKVLGRTGNYYEGIKTYEVCTDERDCTGQ